MEKSSLTMYLARPLRNWYNLGVGSHRSLNNIPHFESTADILSDSEFTTGRLMFGAECRGWGIGRLCKMTGTRSEKRTVGRDFGLGSGDSGGVWIGSVFIVVVDDIGLDTLDDLSDTSDEGELQLWTTGRLVLLSWAVFVWCFNAGPSACESVASSTVAWYILLKRS